VNAVGFVAEHDVAVVADLAGLEGVAAGAGVVVVGPGSDVDAGDLGNAGTELEDAVAADVSFECAPLAVNPP